MEISREIKLPVSSEVVRKQLATAFSAPIIVQKGNLVRARIVCTGRFDGEAILINYKEYGRTYKNYQMTGNLADDSAGSRLNIIVSDNIMPILRFMPLLIWVCFWLATNGLTGITPLSIGGLLIGCFVALLMSRFISSILEWHLRASASKLEETIIRIVTNAGPKTDHF